MRMKRRDFAATLMAVLMAGSIFAGCGSADKNVNHNVETTQNIQNAKDVRLLRRLLQIMKPKQQIQRTKKKQKVQFRSWKLKLRKWIQK